MNCKMKTGALMAMLVMSSGCPSKRHTEDMSAMNEIRREIHVLATNQTASAVWSTRRIRERLRGIKSRQNRRALIEEWEESLSHLDVAQLSFSDRYVSLREVCRLLVGDVVGAREDAGGSFAEKWNGYSRAVVWIGRQVNWMREQALLATSEGKSSRVQLEAWGYYQALMEYREVVIENLELNGLDEKRHLCDISKIGAAREMFERLIGRPVRRSEDVKELGFYRRQVAERVQAEYAAASEQSSR